jgi:hypothetical protein
MPHHPSDPAANPQFRRNWDSAPNNIKFLAELSKRDFDRLAVAHGERVLRGLPAALVAGLQPEERQDLARAFGRPWLRRLQAQRSHGTRRSG